MINIKNVFLVKMLEEIGYAYVHGIHLKTPITYALPSKKLLSGKLNLPESIIDFYNQTAKLEICWVIKEAEENTKVFREDSFLNETYFDRDYDWEFVKELLSGYINITNSEEIFNPEFCKNQGYYYTLSNREENQDDFFPFDICWSLTACVKKNEDTIIDNIWLIDTDANTIIDMKLTIEEYLNLAYQSKGFHYWQIVYLHHKKAEYYELLKRFLPKMLPHVTLDLSAFGIEND